VISAVEGLPRAAWVTAENTRRGTRDWQLRGSWHKGDIEGFADRVSVDTGQSFGMRVSCDGTGFRVEAYRMGDYAGLGGRLVWRSAAQPCSKGPAPTVAAKTNMVSADWPESLRVRTDASWVPGYYLMKLIADSGPEHYVPMTIRDDASHAAYVVQASVTTWQAYNIWGGYDLYEGVAGRRSTFAARARIVSFDRPYDIGAGAGDIGNELPLVSHVEALGLDVTYATDIDLHEEPQRLLWHRALLSLGHDEYWSKAMRDGADAALRAGTNVAFLGANAAFRHIRLQPSALGPDREEVDYKSAREDPLNGKDPQDVTVDWREPPNRRPESELIGDLYECNPVNADLVVADPSSWVLAATGLARGDRLADVIGPEYDRFTPGPGVPTNVAIVAHSPVRCRGHDSYADMTYYARPSGAGVFATGTNWWIARLDGPCPPGSGRCVAHDVATITDNVLAAFGGGPAGLGHPSSSNYATLPHTPAPTPGRARQTTSTTTPGNKRA
jgi:hypothetical protein